MVAIARRAQPDGREERWRALICADKSVAAAAVPSSHPTEGRGAQTRGHARTNSSNSKTKMMATLFRAMSEALSAATNAAAEPSAANVGMMSVRHAHSTCSVRRAQQR